MVSNVVIIVKCFIELYTTDPTDWSGTILWTNTVQLSRGIRVANRFSHVETT